MQLEAGKKYVDRRGRVYGPLVAVGSLFGESESDYCWHEDGRKSFLRSLESDLVAEYDLPTVPVESPDDWVILGQTIYADHVPRVGIDQFQGWEDKWTDQEYFHSKQPIGAWYVATGGNQTRCRRKDLPPVPPVKPVIDPGEGYRLLEPHEVTLPDDERAYFWAADDYSSWDELTQCNPREFVGVKVESLLLSRKEIAIRRKLPPKTRTVTLKEYACWNELHPNACVLVWQTDEARGDDCFDGYDNEHPTGNERTIEISL